MDLPNVRPGALSGTLQPFDADPLVVETVETETQDDAGSGGVDETGDPISLTGEQVGGFDPAQPGDVDLPPVEHVDSLGAQQPSNDEQPPAQTVGVVGIEPTTQLGDVGAPNSAADGSADAGATGEPPTTSEAESSDDSTQSDPNTADAPPADDGQNSTSSSDDTGGN